MPKDYKDNFKETRRRILSFSDKTSHEMVKVINKALGIIGTIAAKDFMVTGGTGGAGKGRQAAPTHPSKTTVRTRELIKSVMGIMGAGVDRGGVPHHIRQVEFRGNEIIGRIGSDLEYAGIHEYGGETHPKVTPKSRRFFWAMHYETGDDKWIGMALTKKDKFDIKIPPRSYLNPARTQAMTKIRELIDREIPGMIKRFGMAK